MDRPLWAIYYNITTSVPHQYHITTSRIVRIFAIMLDA